MPARNVYIALVVIFVSLFVAFKTSVKEQVFRGVASHLENAALYDVDSERLLEGALAGMTDAVGDNYTTYIPSKDKNDYMREIQGQFAGVGLGNFVKDGETGEFYFVPLRGAPAAKAGLKFGDRIVEVDGKSVKELSLFDLANAIRGAEKTTVKLKIRPRASTPAFADAAQTTASAADVLRDVELTRAVVQQDVVSGDRLDENGDWTYTLKDYPEIGYVAIEQFADATPRLKRSKKRAFRPLFWTFAATRAAFSRTRSRFATNSSRRARRSSKFATAPAPFKKFTERLTARKSRSASSFSSTTKARARRKSSRRRSKTRESRRSAVRALTAKERFKAFSILRLTSGCCALRPLNFSARPGSRFAASTAKTLGALPRTPRSRSS